VRVLTSQTSCVTCLGFSPDGQQLAAGTDDGTVAVYDLGSARRCVPARTVHDVNRSQQLGSFHTVLRWSSTGSLFVGNVTVAVADT
jgi:WD40 repeat protein